MSDNLKGALWIMLSAAFATVMSVGIKDLGPGVHSMQITFMRCIVGFIIVVPFVWGRQLREARRSGAPLRFELSKRWPLHLLRGVLATIAINCGYYSITQIPLATVTVLFFTAPFFVTLLAVPLLGEKVGWRRWCATTFGFIGALVTLNPEVGELDPVMIFPFAASLFFAGALIIESAFPQQRHQARFFFTRWRSRRLAVSCPPYWFGRRRMRNSSLFC